MDSPLINIITRVSRKEKFKRCYESIHGQTYKNINHICTYQNDDIREFLEGFKNLNLQRVPNLKRMEGLYYSYDHHVLTDDFINPDWEFFNRKVNSEEDTTPKKVEEVRYEKNGFFCYTLPHTFRVRFQHSPYNLFMKIAEKRVKDGWVYYLDDDDYFCDENVLSKIVDEIKKFDEETLHIFRTMYKNDIFPSDHFWNYMKTGHPFIVNEIGGSHFVFHSKYLDYTVWDEWSGADYRTAKSLEKVIKNKNFTDIISIVAEISGGKNVDV
jgi:hypothetical protein